MDDIISAGIHMTRMEIGCCGAYCRTCREYRNGHCKGCRLGYGEGGRDINRAKCKMKLCCFRDRGFETCADCPDVDGCPVLQTWLSKQGYKYKKYREALEYIRENGYEEFEKRANGWKNACGKLE